MQQDILNNWHSLYALIGGGSANLMGLMFVAISIGARLITRETVRWIHVLMTPVLVHFAAVLVVSSLVMAPLVNAAWLEGALFLTPLAGIAYLILWVLPGMHGYRRIYQMKRLEMMMHIAAPALCYSLMIVAAIILRMNAQLGLGMIATGALSLQLISIQRAWTAIVYMAVKGADSKAIPSQADDSPVRRDV